MKKVLSLIAVVVMAAALLLSYSTIVKNSIAKNSDSKLSYATMVPIPPPKPKTPVGL